MNGNIAPSSGLDVDHAATSRFVELVFGNLEGFVAVRTIPVTGTAAQHAQSEYHRPVELVAALKRLGPRDAQQAKGLYVVPATVERSGSAKAADIRQTGVVVVDVDTGDIESKVMHLRQHLGTPTLEVASGGTTADGYVERHVYWKLAEAAAADDLGRVRALRECIAVKVGADPSFKSLH